MFSVGNGLQPIARAVYLPGQGGLQPWRRLLWSSATLSKLCFPAINDSCISKINQSSMQQFLFKKMKYLLVLPLLFAAFAGVWAQSLTVKGKVTDENGGGLPGVTVLVKGTTNGTATDAEGNYSLGIGSGNATLVITFIGYNTQEIAINHRSTINVAMKTDTKALEEVVVIGYGTVSKEALTGSVSSVGGRQHRGGSPGRPPGRGAGHHHRRTPGSGSADPRPRGQLHHPGQLALVYCGWHPG
jgi:hypothetical protein